MQLFERLFENGGPGAHEQPAVRKQRGAGHRLDRGPQPSPEAIPRDRGPDAPADREREARRDDLVIREVPAPQRLGPGVETIARQPLERSSLADSANSQAESRLRPFRRRALTIDRPARVRIRARKPCLRARRLVLGWKVRFTAAPKVQVASNSGGTTEADLARALNPLAEARTEAVTYRPAKATARPAPLATGRPWVDTRSQTARARPGRSRGRFGRSAEATSGYPQPVDNVWIGSQVGEQERRRR